MLQNEMKILSILLVLASLWTQPCFGKAQSISIKFDIPMTYNAEVKKWVKFFKKNRDHYFQSWLEKARMKVPKIKKILKRQGLPEDLAYLPLIESGLNSHAVSHAQAVGYWQFIEPTAKRYRLRVNWWLDERRDLIKSSWAAANYLKDLYKLFDDWYLALSAYNMGETRLRRLIKRHKSKDFWQLSKQRGFPLETRDYVPKFLAAALIAKGPSHFGFRDALGKNSDGYTYHYVPGGTDLYKVANLLDIPRETMETLNPELTHSYIPEKIQAHRIRVPKNFSFKVNKFAEQHNVKKKTF